MYFYIIILIVFSWCHHCVIAEECAKDKSTTTSRLKEELLCNYDKTIRPKIDRGNATNVTISMMVKSIAYSMHYQEITINCWFGVIWDDDHLVWTPSEHDGIENINININEIWSPDFSLYNRASEGESPSAISAEIDCFVSHNGRIVCIVPSQPKAICIPVLKHFPFDTQNCTLKFGSWIHSGEKLNFKLNPFSVAMEDYEENGEWEVISHNVVKNIERYDCCPNETYPSLIYSFMLKRHPGNHICSSVTPLFVMTIMTILALFYDPEDKDRFLMILINIVAHFLYLQYFNWQLPYSGPSVPLILLFCRDSLFLTAFTLILTTFQKHLIQTKRQTPVWVSMIVAGVINSKPGQYIFIFSGMNMKTVGNRIGDEDGESIIEDPQSQRNNDWIIFSKILNSMCIFSYVLVYFVMIISFIP